AYGYGPGGVIFFLAQGIGATLAIYGAGVAEQSIGRIMMVVAGTALWIVQLNRYTKRDPKIERLWTWTRVLESLGLVAPKSDQQVNRNVAHWAARVAKAIRQSNSRWPTPGRWLARRRIIKFSETLSDEIMDLGRQRAAGAHLSVTQADYGSKLM